MRILQIFILIATTLNSFGQKNVIGKYYHNYGHELLLNSDSTYEFKSNFDLSESWSRGKWSCNRDTVYLLFIPVFDTLGVGWDTKPDTLVLSSNTRSERIDSIAYIASILSGGGQNRIPNPSKLFFRKNALYEIGPTGQPVTKNLYDPIKRKYFTTKFYKSKE